jgi:hypothetical protein
MRCRFIGSLWHSVVLLGLLLGSNCPSAQPASSEHSYGAFAVVAGQGRDYHGYGTGTSEEYAKKAAMAQCLNHRCKVATVYGPGQCAHIALGKRQVFWNNRLFSKREGIYVLELCKKQDSDCKIIKSECFPEATYADPTQAEPTQSPDTRSGF